MVSVTIPPLISHFATRPAYVYLPPAWFARVTPSLPTLVLLPGEPGSASDWSGDGDADNTADAFAELTTVWPRSWSCPIPTVCSRSTRSAWTADSEAPETYLVEDVPAFVRNQLHASRAPDSLAVGDSPPGGPAR